VGEVRSFQEVKREFNKEVVECLEGLLEEAKKGEVLSICYIVERPGNVMSFLASPSEDRFKQIGAATRMVYELNLELDEYTYVME
jgi:hypothetical protein